MQWQSNPVIKAYQPFFTCFLYTVVHHFKIHSNIMNIDKTYNTALAKLQLGQWPGPWPPPCRRNFCQDKLQLPPSKRLDHREGRGAQPHTQLLHIYTNPCSKQPHILATQSLHLFNSLNLILFSWPSLHFVAFGSATAVVLVLPLS
jgi:hypothetical protein